MAEFPELGKYCAVDNCCRLDFLPFQCKFCQQSFCKQHFQPDGHQCSKKQYQQKEIKSDPEACKFYACSLDGCNNVELVPVICPICGQSHCLQHRHEGDHRCRALPVASEYIPKTKELVDKKQDSDAGKERKGQGRKCEKIATKVHLMKMKMKASGNSSLPEEEKVYLFVHLPLDVPDRRKAVFISKHWSIGKVIDVIADVTRIANNSHLTAAPKLQLFRLSDGQLLSAKMDRTVTELLEAEEIFSGESVILEYVSERLTQIENVQCYK